MARSTRTAIAGMLLASLLAGCGSSTPSLSAAPSAVAIPSAVAAVSPSPTPAPSATASPTPAPTATPTPAPTATPTPSPSKAPVTVKLPSNWKPLTITEEALTKSAQLVAARNPQLGQTISLLVTSGMWKSIETFAFRYKSSKITGDLVTTHLGSLGGMSLDVITPLLESQLKTLGAKSVVTKKVTLPASSAVQLDFILKVNTGAGSSSLVERVWVLEVDGSGYEVAVSCVTDVPKCLAEGSRIAVSLRVP